MITSMTSHCIPLNMLRFAVSAPREGEERNGRSTYSLVTCESDERRGIFTHLVVYASDAAIRFRGSSESRIAML